MKFPIILIVSILIFSCNNKPNTTNEETNTEVSNRIENEEFQAIIDSADVHGAILIYDLQDNKYYSNDFIWAKKGHLPASTFKIPNSIIAMETGVIADDSTLIKWNGEKRAFEIWEQDLIFRDAFQFSCVPCYQEIARKIGIERMTNYLTKLNYGSMKVDSTNLDLFWLEGESKIAQFQQIDFLKKLYLSEVPISESTEENIKSMMILASNENYTLRGKTGWSIKNGINNGWFVGYIEVNEKVYFFATNIEPNEDFNMDMFAVIRKDITIESLKVMEII